MKIKRPVGGWVATKFNVKHQGKYTTYNLQSIIYKWPLSDLPESMSTLCPSLSLSFTTVASSPDQHNNLYSCEPRVHQWSQSTLSGVLKRKFGTLWKKEQFCVDPLEVIMYDDQAWDLQTIRSFVLAATLHSHSITQKVRIAHILLLIIKPDCQTSSAGQHLGHIALLSS